MKFNLVGATVATRKELVRRKWTEVRYHFDKGEEYTVEKAEKSEMNKSGVRCTDIHSEALSRGGLYIVK